MTSTPNSERLNIYNLYVQPTYAVHLPQPAIGARTKTLARLENEKNLKDNRQKGVISSKAQRKLMNAVNWLIASSSRKWIYDKSTQKRFSFRVNFITLTLPTLDHSITDHKFKSVLLHAFINACRYKYNLSNYVWKVEAQANGNIHAHFTTDCFIHWRDLRNTWNKILRSHGLIDAYQQKHSGISFDEYSALYGANYSDISAMRRAFDFGVSTNWSEPNTTDVKAVHKIDDIGAYMAKYLAKNEDDRRPISGRLWGCSYSLSTSNKLVIECVPGRENTLLNSVDFTQVKSKIIERKSKLTGQGIPIGELFLYSQKDWGRSIRGELFELFNEHRWRIRNSATVHNLEYKPNADLEQPAHFAVTAPAVFNNSQTFKFS